MQRDGNATRVLEIPGADFSAYRWGNTVEPVTPGLIDRPYLAREVLPYGSPQTVNLLDALDRRMQEGTFEPASLAAVARLLGIGTDLAALRPAVRALRHRRDLGCSGQQLTQPTSRPGSSAAGVRTSRRNPHACRRLPADRRARTLRTPATAPTRRRSRCSR